MLLTLDNKRFSHSTGREPGGGNGTGTESQDAGVLPRINKIPCGKGRVFVKEKQFLVCSPFTFYTRLHGIILEQELTKQGGPRDGSSLKVL